MDWGKEEIIEDKEELLQELGRDPGASLEHLETRFFQVLIRKKWANETPYSLATARVRYLIMSASTLTHANSPYIVFSDFDGTITTEDSNDAATDNLGFGLEKRRALNLEILNGTKTFRDAFREMLDSVAERHSFDEVREYLKNKIKLDPGFKVFFEWCKAHSVPVVIVSSGMVPIIRAIMENLVGVEDAAKIEIVANDVKIDEKTGKWEIVFRHPESGFGHDKSRSTGPYRELEHKPTLFFCGDGVSDLSAARAADLLFVKVIPNHTNDLSVHCIREKIPFLPFEQFVQVKDVVESVVEGKTTIPALLAPKA